VVTDPELERIASILADAVDAGVGTAAVSEAG
jgi:hypothetical protein